MSLKSNQTENQNKESNGSSFSFDNKANHLKGVEKKISDSEKGKSVITLAGNLAIGGGNFIVINATDTDAKNDLNQVLDGIKKISPDAVDKIINALADKISKDN